MTLDTQEPNFYIDTSLCVVFKKFSCSTFFIFSLSQRTLCCTESLFTTITHFLKHIRIAFMSHSMTEVVKRLHMISQIIGIIHNNPYDLSGTAGIERPFTKLLQQRFVTIHTDIIFDNRIAFFF